MLFKEIDRAALRRARCGRNGQLLAVLRFALLDPDVDACRLVEFPGELREAHQGFARFPRRKRTSRTLPDFSASSFGRELSNRLAARTSDLAFVEARGAFPAALCLPEPAEILHRRFASRRRDCRARRPPGQVEPGTWRRAA